MSPKTPQEYFKVYGFLHGPHKCDTEEEARALVDRCLNHYGGGTWEITKCLEIPVESGKKEWAKDDSGD